MYEEKLDETNNCYIATLQLGIEEWNMIPINTYFLVGNCTLKSIVVGNWDVYEERMTDDVFVIFWYGNELRVF